MTRKVQAVEKFYIAYQDCKFDTNEYYSYADAEKAWLELSSFDRCTTCIMSYLSYDKNVMVRH